MEERGRSVDLETVHAYIPPLFPFDTAALADTQDSTRLIQGVENSIEKHKALRPVARTAPESVGCLRAWSGKATVAEEIR